MTAGHDYRPVTVCGSIRQSDVTHRKNLRTANFDAEESDRRCHEAEVNEQIQDFEHKLGWKMRSNLGPRWVERRAMELEEARIIGLRKQSPLRPPSPSHFYDYQMPQIAGSGQPEHVMTELRSLRGSGSVDLQTFEGASALPDRPDTGYESVGSVQIVTRRSLRTSSHHTDTSGNFSRSAQGGYSSYGSNGPAARTSMKWWTSQSMLEPIFMPASQTQRVLLSRLQPAVLSQTIPSRRTAKWEDGPGRRFWQVQERNLQAAVRRTEAENLQDQQMKGEKLRKSHDKIVSTLRVKHNQAVKEARNRKEYYPRAKIFAEHRFLEVLKKEQDERELRELNMGMKPEELKREATLVASETTGFEERLRTLRR